MVTSTESSRAVRGRQQGIDLVRGEEADIGALGALDGNGEDALDQMRVFGVAHRREAEHRANGGQPSVSSSHAVAALVLEMLEEGGDEVGIEIGEVEL